MENAKSAFANRLRTAMEAAGYEAKPSVLEREFNLRYWGKAMTLHGVRRWLKGETMPGSDKLKVLADWLRVLPQELSDDAELARRIQEHRSRWDAEIGYQERELFEAFMRLPVAQRKTLREVVLAFVRAYGAAESGVAAGGVGSSQR